MTRNMNNLDRGLRAFISSRPRHRRGTCGAGSAGGVPLFALAAVMLATSAAGFCPLYTLLHVNTSGRTPLPH